MFRFRCTASAKLVCVCQRQTQHSAGRRSSKESDMLFFSSIFRFKIIYTCVMGYDIVEISRNL